MDEDAVLEMAEKVSMDLHGCAADVALSALALVTAGMLEQCGMSREVYSYMLRLAAEEEVQA